MAPTVLPPYVLVTAARDEAPAIGRTIDAVARQDHLPARWVIVSDGSSDGTDDIVRDRAKALPWLRLERIDRDGGAGFAHKASAIRRAYHAVEAVPHDVVAHLDADVCVPEGYYRACVDALTRDRTLGITGGVVVEAIDGRQRRQRAHRSSVAGGVQVFRRRCWEAIGRGYPAIEGGGEDAAAEVLARAAGYAVRCLPELQVVHDGPVLGGARSLLGARWVRGELHWRLGYRPSFQLAAAVARVTEPPVVLGSLATLAAYGRAALTGARRTAPPEVVARLREEQAARLRAHLSPGARRARRAVP